MYFKLQTVLKMVQITLKLNSKSCNGFEWGIDWNLNCYLLKICCNFFVLLHIQTFQQKDWIWCKTLLVLDPEFLVLDELFPLYDRTEEMIGLSIRSTKPSLVLLHSTTPRNIVWDKISRVLLVFLAVTYRKYFTFHSVPASAGSPLGEILIKTSSAGYLTPDTR